ncbi:uncharacterized protein LOC102671486 isoform X2 [Apis dorsata]|uniref:uncharacterized protein LOC102671486 isoform X2 n=1 Tax=Apis dorsata TaxID=7462 RepID=UPI0003DF59A7|nr:uncharacterized protein LOC102671486 isoform X2 [Apis dorsata]
MGQPYSLKLVYPLLKILGAWPKSSPSSVLSTILKCCLIFICYLIQLMVLIPGILYIFLKEANLGGKIKMFVPHMNGITQVSKYTILLRQIKEFNIILNEVKRDYSLATDKNMWIFTTRAYIGHKMMIAIAIAMYSSGVGYRMILPFLKGRILLPDNTTVRLLPCPGYYMFFNEQVTPNYEIIFTIQVLGGFLNYTTLCGTTGITTMLCLHMCSLLKILINKMNDLTCQSDECERVVRKKLADIVEYQMKIIDFLNHVEQLTSYLYFCEILEYVCGACVIGYCLITEWENSNGAALIVYFILEFLCIFCTLTICYIGQLLIDESDKVRQISVTLDWYRLPVNEARGLILVIIMSNYPIKVTAGKIVDISLITFTDIVKTSVGYLNILRTVA